MRKQLPILDAAQLAGVTVNDLLNMAASDEIYLGATLGPFVVDGRNYAGRELKHAPQIKTGGKSETCILPHEAKEILLSGTTTAYIWRDPGHENGVSIPQLSSESVVFFLREPQTISRDVLWVYEDELPAAHQVAIKPMKGNSQEKTVKKLKNRSHPLDAVIKQAEKNAADVSKPQSVWDALVAIANSNTAPAPLIGFAEGEGIKYRSDTKDGGVDIYAKRSFFARCNRLAKSRQVT